VTQILTTENSAAQHVLDKKCRYLIPCVFHFYRHPPVFVRGEGMYLFDSGGKPYMDLFSGVSVNALGHCHPELVEEIRAQVSRLQHTTTIYLTDPIVDLAEALADVLPGDLSRTFFCASGSEANEGAALLATLHTGQSNFIAFENALHGRTKLAMSLTGLPMWRTDPNPVPGITHVPHPSCSNGSLNAIEEALRSTKPAAMFVEPVQGNGGINVAPSGYFQKLRALLDQHDVLLIADEVQTGFGRTGAMFAMDHWGVVPDILTGGKALGGGTPIGFLSTSDAIASSFTRPSASTFGGNPVTAVAALSFLRILQRDGLVQKCARRGERLKSCLDELARPFDFVTDVRGLGMMIGMEIGAHGDRTGAAMVDEILERMKDAGYLLGKTGADRNVLTWMPPMIVTDQQIEEATHALEFVLRSL
jgi:4-aminobutyrate aminotransferase-like enzyme